MSHPDISFQLIKDGAEALHTPGDGKLESAIYAALGREFARSLLAVEGRGGEVAVEGYVTMPLQSRGSRSMQVFFVNGRFIKSQLLTAALEEGYRNQIMKGKFPGCVLSVTLPVTAVDVNVHPAKTTVKFAREKEVFDAVYHTVLDCLSARGGAVQVPRSVEQVVLPRQDFFQSLDAKSFRERREQADSQPRSAARPAWDSERRSTARVADSAPPASGYGRFRDAGGALGRPPASVAGPTEAETSPAGKSEKPFVPAIPRQSRELPEQQTMEPLREEAPWRIAGEVLRTYIVCESEEGCVWLIDKHAAHERINFDRLKASRTAPMRQMLLKPAIAELSREDAAAVLDNLPLLEELGFSCEDFGGGAVLVREVPADLDAGETSAALEEFAGTLRGGGTLDEKREELLHTIACKSAIKGGWKSDVSELRVLVEKVQSGEVRYCPHGRPVAVKLSRYELEKLFKRA